MNALSGITFTYRINGLFVDGVWWRHTLLLFLQFNLALGIVGPVGYLTQTSQSQHNTSMWLHETLRFGGNRVCAWRCPVIGFRTGLVLFLLSTGTRELLSPNPRSSSHYCS